MAYDSRIILGGQGPDIMGSVAAGNQVAAQTNALRASNELANLYRTQGAGILAGDKSALNALAGIDPNAALGVQGAQLGMDATRQNMAFGQEEMQMKRDQIKAQAAEHAATLTAEQRAAEAAQIETGVKAASTAQTPEQWDAIVTQFGQPDLVGQFGMKDALLASYADVADILKGGGGELPAGAQTLEWRAMQAGLKPGTPEYQKFMLEGDAPKQGGMVVYGPDGKPIVSTGGATPGGLTNANTTDAQKAQMSYKSLMDGLDEYERIYSEGGGTVLPGEQKDKLLGARRSLQLQMKELYNLGVLNGPDLALMDALFVDPTSVGNNLMDAVGFADMDSRVKTNMTQLRKQFKDMVEPKLAALGIQMPTEGQTETTAPGQSPTLSDDDLLRKYGG